VSAPTTLAARVLEVIQAEGLEVGSHLPAQLLADRLRVSRSPINECLKLLQRRGMLRHEPNRGYFLAKPVGPLPADAIRQLGLAKPDIATRAYFRIAEDRLKGALPDEFTETMLRNRYRLTAAQLESVLARIASEGWAEKKPGYGWAFSAVLTTPDALLQSYRMRLALEPKAILEPGFHLPPAILERCRAAERHLLEGGIDTDTPDQLHERGVRFHESIVEASGNPFFVEAIRRVNRVRRLLSYRSTQDRSRFREHCEQHLHILDLLERGRNEEASEAMHHHLARTLRNMERIRGILKTETPRRK